MHSMTYQEAFWVLSQAGFVGAEIDRLYRLRRAYRTSELDQPPLDVCRLQFIRWLVATGQLTEGLPEAKEQIASHLNKDPERLRGAPLARFDFPLLRRKE